MKTNTLKLVFAFCILNSTMFNFTIAQVVYTDVVPDTTVNTNGNAYSLDLNNDGTADFNITYSTSQITGTCLSNTYTSTRIYIRVTPFGSNEVGHVATSSYTASLLPGVLIDSTAFTWVNSANQVISEKLWACLGGRPLPGWRPYYVGSWNGATSKYLPLRLHVGAQSYYGWVCMTVPAGTASFTVKDYAYDSTASNSILAAGPLPTVSGLPADSFCAGSVIRIPFTAIADFYNPGNKFIAELSDAAGSFNSPVLLDSVAAVSSDTIVATTPVIAASGNGYKIRIRSTDPVVTGPTSTTSLKLLAPPSSASIVSTIPAGLDSVCSIQGSNLLYANAGFGLNYQWYHNGLLLPGTTSPLDISPTGAGIYTVVDSNRCGVSSPSAPFSFYVASPLNARLFGLSPICTTDPPFLLTTGLPPGGVYSGAGVNSATSMLDPSLLSAGVHTITYTIHDSVMVQCRDSASRGYLVNVCTGLDERSLADAFVYSNGKQLTLHLHDGVRPEGTCTIYNAFGQEIRKAEIRKQVTEFDLGDCSSGIYFVVMQSMERIETRKIFLE